MNKVRIGITGLVVLLLLLAIGAGTVATAQYSSATQYFRGDTIHSYNSGDSDVNSFEYHKVRSSSYPQIHHRDVFILRRLIINPRAFVDSRTTSKLENKLDPSKPTTDCAGNYLHYRDVYKYKNILEKTYDLYELKNVAISKGFEVTLIEDWSYIDNWEVDRFNEKYELGFELKKGDNLNKGPVKIIVTDEGIVKISGPRITIKKTISEEEKYRITLRYEPDYYLKESIQVVQDGRCNFKDSYLKIQVKDFLKELNLESRWVNKATIEINGLCRALRKNAVIPFLNTHSGVEVGESMTHTVVLP